MLIPQKLTQFLCSELAKSVCVCHRETAWESLRLQKRETLTVCFVLVWVYFERERFESGFRDLTLCVKVLRSLQDQAKIPFFLHMIDHQELTKL